MIKTNVTDCSSAIKGLGTLGCKIDYNYITQFGLMEKGVSIDLSTADLDKATIDALVQSGKLIILPAHNSFDSVTEETVYETLPSGAKLPVRNGLYEFLPMYSKGSCFGNALASLSTKQWGLVMIDLDNDGESRMWGDVSSSNLFSGFDLGLVFAENRTFNDGSVSTKTPLRLQLSTKGSGGLKSRGRFISSNAAVDFAQIGGVNDVALEVVSTVAATFAVKALISCDGSTSISANTSVSNWKITDTSDDSDVVPSGITFVNGSYLFAGVAAGTYTIRFYDKTNSSDVVVADNTYYESDLITVTLT